MADMIIERDRDDANFVHFKFTSKTFGPFYAFTMHSDTLYDLDTDFHLIFLGMKQGEQRNIQVQFSWMEGD